MEKEKRGRGLRDVLFVVMAAALMMSPSYIAGIVVGRFEANITLMAIVSLALFLVGAFLMLRLLRD